MLPCVHEFSKRFCFFIIKRKNDNKPICPSVWEWINTVWNVLIHGIPYSRGSQPRGCRPLLVRSLLGTGPHSRRWVAVESEASSAAPHCSPSLVLPPEPSTSPTPPQPRSMEKLSSMKPVPGAKKVGDRCPTDTKSIACGGFWMHRFGKIRVCKIL